MKAKFFVFYKFIQFCLIGLVSLILAGMFIKATNSSQEYLIIGLTTLNIFCWNELVTFRDTTEKQTEINELVERFFKFSLICFTIFFLGDFILDNFVSSNLEPSVSDLAHLSILVLKIYSLFWLSLKFVWKVNVKKTSQFSQKDKSKPSKKTENTKPLKNHNLISSKKQVSILDNKETNKLNTDIKQDSQSKIINKIASASINPAYLDLEILTYLRKNENASFIDLLSNLKCDKQHLRDRLLILQEEEFIKIVNKTDENNTIYKML
jgi:putative flippase GtrA